jgi:hypothetical protein
MRILNEIISHQRWRFLDFLWVYTWQLLAFLNKGEKNEYMYLKMLVTILNTNETQDPFTNSFAHL